jgi:hypothetical protein
MSIKKDYLYFSTEYIIYCQNEINRLKILIQGNNFPFLNDFFKDLIQTYTIILTKIK